MRSIPPTLLPLLLAACWGEGSRDLMPSMAAGPVAPMSTGRRIAWVVGEQGYERERPLGNPLADARAWAELLERGGFTVVAPCYDCTLRELRAGLEAFGGAIQPGDEAFFFYSGHAAEQEGRNLLFPVDARIASCADLDEQTVSLNSVMGRMEEARVAVAVLDACRNPPFKSCVKASGDLLASEPSPPAGSLIAYATRRADVASDGAGDHSPYTAALLEFAAVPGRPFWEAQGLAAARVVEITGGRQEPWIQGSPQGTPFVLIPGERPEVARLREELAAREARIVELEARESEDGVGYVAGPTGPPVADTPAQVTETVLRSLRGEEVVVAARGRSVMMTARDLVPTPVSSPPSFLVALPFDLAVLTTEVTQEMWSGLGLVETPGAKGPRWPVRNVSWCDAVAFANLLSDREGLDRAYESGELRIGLTQDECGRLAPSVRIRLGSAGYRLPTEAEWEYLSSAPHRVLTSAGAWPSLHEVATGWRGPNGHGLFDMASNVSEWTGDWEREQNPGKVEPVAGPSSGERKILRGGSYDLGGGGQAESLSLRRSMLPGSRTANVGFRLVRSLVGAGSGAVLEPPG